MLDYLSEKQFDEIKDSVNIYSISSKELENISRFSFSCGKAKEYEDFLRNEAKRLESLCISKTFVLIHKNTKELIGYFSLSADTVKLTLEEKNSSDLDGVSFMSLPAIKVGKLAVNKDLSNTAKRKGYGSFILEIANTFAFEVLKAGVACRFITVDADVEYYPNTTEFYLKNGFKHNLSQRSRSANHTVSMRRDIFA